MKFKGKKEVKEVPLINLLSAEDLERLNKRFGTFYKPQNKMATAKIIIETRLDEFDRLMRRKPERGGYGA